jgi:hypothetical protein
MLEESHMSAQTIFLMVITGFVFYLVIRIYLAALGCIVVSIVSFVLVLLIYEGLHLFGLA